MKKFILTIRQSPLFHDIDADDIKKALNCLQASVHEYIKGEPIFSHGNSASRVGLLLEGMAEVIRDDVFGNRSILTKLSTGDLFGETFACADIDTLPVSVIAVGNCMVLLLDYRKIITTCSASCSFHSRLIENMLQILAQKNLLLNSKIEVLSARTIRDKLLTFLNAQALDMKSNTVVLAYDRQELADYLSVDRSALSREIGAMQKEELIRVKGNRFELIARL